MRHTTEVQAISLSHRKLSQAEREREYDRILDTSTALEMVTLKSEVREQLKELEAHNAERERERMRRNRA